MSKYIAIFYHKEDWITIFCRLKDVFVLQIIESNQTLFSAKTES